MLAVDALQNVILRLYGPQAGGQVQANHLMSYPFTNLSAILEGGTGDPALESSVRQAGWVVINMLDAEPGEVQTTLSASIPFRAARFIARQTNCCVCF